jgi:hypothetical protein
MIEILVNRITQTSDDTISTVEVDGVLKYYGLEILKCIPAGRYPVTKYFSPDHQAWMPLVNNVPGFAGIEIHIANTVKDVKGCLGIADNIVSDEYIANSAAAVHPFYADFFASLEAGHQVFITYKNLF